jgi:hypothetical protein
MHEATDMTNESNSRKHTHRGSCQACGRVQAHQANGLIAKHGYTVDWGFFNGICAGADRKPLEVDKTLTLQIIEQLRNDVAPKADKRAADLTSGAIEPTFYKRGKWDGRLCKFEEIKCDRADLDVYAAQRFIDAAIHRAKNDAAMARSHAAMLEKLIVARFGQPLIAVDHDARKQSLKVGARVQIGGKKGWVGEVVEIKNQVARGCGPYMNGKVLLHAFLRSPKGNIIAIPTRTIRSSAIVD